jgi:hypothetical protein
MKGTTMKAPIENHGPEEIALRAYVNVVTDPSPDHLAHLRQDALTRITAGTVPGQRRDQWRHGSMGRGFWGSRAVSIGAAGALVLGAAVAVGVNVLPHARHSSRVTADPVSPASPVDPVATALINAKSARETFRLLANRTTVAQPASARTGSFLYTKEHELLLQTAVGPDGTAAYVYELVKEVWSNVDDLRDVRITGTRGLNAHALTPADEVKLRKYGVDFNKVVPFEGHPGPEQGMPNMGNPTPAYLVSLPTDPKKLLNVLRAENDASNGDTALADSLIFKTIPTLATRTDAVMSPQLRSALYEVLGLLPGVQRVPGQVTVLGQTGVAVENTVNDDRRTEIIFDPKTARIIGTADVAAKDTKYADNVPVSKGTVLHAKISEQTAVGKVGATS